MTKLVTPELGKRIRQICRTIHRYPERDYQEEKTATLIEATLQERGLVAWK